MNSRYRAAREMPLLEPAPLLTVLSQHRGATHGNQYVAYDAGRLDYAYWINGVLTAWLSHEQLPDLVLFASEKVWWPEAHFSERENRRSNQ